MTVPMREANVPTTESTVADFENRYGLRLPGSYRRFLLKSNGGVPQNATFQIVGLPLNPLADVQVFFGFGSKWPGTDLEEIYATYAAVIPSGVVPIADDGGGNYVCLDLRSGRELIAFWDKSHYWSTGVWREKDLYPVADSFYAFLGGLE